MSGTYSDKAIRKYYATGYRVTDDGRLLNPEGVELTVNRPKSSPYPIKQWYVEGNKRSFTVHKFAAYCFFGEEALTSGLQVRHLNADTEDISKSNIALGTCSENHLDKPAEVRRRSALLASQSRKNMSRRSLRKLTDEQVREIKLGLRDGVGGVALSKKYGVSDETIYQIKRGVTYKEITI